MTIQQAQRNNNSSSNNSTINTFTMGCCWLGLLLLAGIQTCSAGPSLRSRNLIVGGGTPRDNRFPYFVALKNAEREIQCGGTLIAPDIVLTAAHCRNSNLIYADVGKYSNIGPEGLGEEIEIMNPLVMMSSGNWSTVGKLQRSNATIIDASGFVHPRHNLKRRTYDVMLMKLARPALSPIVKVNKNRRAPIKEAGGKNEITIIGMGNTEKTGVWPKPSTLKQVHVDYLPYEECVDVENYNLNYKFELRPHMICTMGAGTYGDRGQCYGDSGGPYIITGDTPDQDVQVGVVSWAVDCANSVFPMVGSRTASSLKFIKKVTCSMSSNPPADLCLEENNSIHNALQSRYIPDGVTVSVRVFSDPFGHELKWEITDEFNETKVYAEAPYGSIVGDHSFQDVVVPSGGNLKFKINDAADDGIYGDPDAILYEIVLVDSFGELVMVEGNGQFGYSREETFRVPQFNEEYLALVRASNGDTTELAQSVGPTAPLKIYINFADYHEDAAWKVTSLDGTQTFGSKNANEYRLGNDVTEQVNLAAGDYKFTISDRRGTDDFRAFNSYKLSYQDSQQRSGLGGETIVYESVGLFEGEEISHDFVIPISATADTLDLASSQEVIIDNADFWAEAEIQLCQLIPDGDYCETGAGDQCCSGICRASKCRATNGGGGGGVNGRDRMRSPISEGAGGSARGYDRT